MPSGTIEELTANNKLTEENQKKVDALDAILKNDPKNIQALLKKGFYLFDDRVDGNAIETFNKVIEIDPNCIDAYVWLAELYIYHWSEVQKADEALKKALKINPDNAAVHRLIASGYLEAYPGGYSKQDILYHLKKAIELEPSWIAPRVSLISLLFVEGQYALAKKELDEAYGQFQDDFPEPKDDMERYYEQLITGRFGFKVSLDKFKKELDEKLS